MQNKKVKCQQNSFGCKIKDRIRNGKEQKNVVENAQHIRNDSKAQAISLQEENMLVGSI